MIITIQQTTAYCRARHIFYKNALTGHHTFGTDELAKIHPNSVTRWRLVDVGDLGYICYIQSLAYVLATAKIFLASKNWEILQFTPEIHRIPIKNILGYM